MKKRNYFYLKRIFREMWIQSQTSSSSSPEKVSVTGLNTSTLQSTEDSGEEFELVLSKKLKTDYISLDTKIKILNMVREHPNWSLKTIQNRGSGALKNKSDLKKW